MIVHDIAPLSQHIMVQYVCICRSHNVSTKLNSITDASVASVDALVMEFNFALTLCDLQRNTYDTAYNMMDHH